jgi:hypothetical protein
LVLLWEPAGGEVKAESQHTKSEQIMKRFAIGGPSGVPTSAPVGSGQILAAHISAEARYQRPQIPPYEIERTAPIRLSRLKDLGIDGEHRP